jgi:hypothetical protein
MGKTFSRGPSSLLAWHVEQMRLLGRAEALFPAIIRLLRTRVNSGGWKRPGEQPVIVE